MFSTFLVHGRAGGPVRRALLVVVLAAAVLGPAPSEGAPRARQATTAKGKVTPPSAAEIGALASADLEVAARAAETLGANTSPAAHEALLDALALGVPPEVAVPALRAVAARPVAFDIATLARYANHANPSVRSAAVAALASYAQPDAHQVIVARLGDHVVKVRAAAAAAAAQGKVRTAVDPLLVLLQRGEEGAVHALAAMADPDLARRIAELIGKMPEPALAMCLGEILRRPDFGPDTARVELVRAIGKIQDPAAVAALVDYLDSSAKPIKLESQQEAKGIVDARGGAR